MEEFMFVNTRGIGLFLLFFISASISIQAQPERLQFEQWGNIGIGRLVTKMSNSNVIGAGRINYPEMSRFPAFEFPYNPDPDGRHIYYGNMVAFHVGGLTLDRGPTWNGEDLERHTVESADQNHYKFYKGFHFDAIPGYSGPSQSDPIPVSNDETGWPAGGWPSHYPTTDPFLSNFYPNYPTIYNTGIANPVPLHLDSRLGFPGAGPNKYSPPDIYEPGQVVADQETFTVSHSRNRQDDIHRGKLMIYTTLRGLSWGGELAQDILFWIFTVTNIGLEPIYDTYFGLKANFDFPWASFIAYNTYSLSDAYALDTYAVDEETGKEYKIAYGWDGDGNVPGANRGAIPYSRAKLTDETPLDQVAMAGVTFLQTPKDSLTGEELGITTWNPFIYSVNRAPHGIGNDKNSFYRTNILNENDPGDLNGDGISDWTWEKPFPVGMEELYDNGYRSAMIINTGPFTLMPGETDTLIVATMMGWNRDHLFGNAKMARDIFTAGWLVPKPPYEPRVIADIESGRIILRWGNISENDELNELAGRQKFQGYKIYRSIDGGQTWGDRPITDETGTVVDYVPLAQYDLIDGITGPSPVLPFFNRGSDSGFGPIYELTDRVQEINLPDLNMTVADTLQYTFIDNDVIDGFNYRYAVVAYGAGEEDPSGLRPLQNSRTSGPNIKSVIPHAQPAQSLEDLSRVKVVPNPYVVVNPLETGVRERMIKFTRIPAVCTIRIFNVAGELIETIYHNEEAGVLSEAKWNLRSSENREVAPGLYLFHLESDIGVTTGKFVIIK
jgi:hypothetical protein